MRKTVKERYGDALGEAVCELRKIEEQLGNCQDAAVAVRRAEEWKRQTGEVIAMFGLPDEVRSFHEHQNLAECHTVDSATSALSAYDSMLIEVLRALPESDVKHGYDEDVQRPLAIIDDLLVQISDLYRRATTGQRVNPQTAVDGLERWLDRAHKRLTPILGEDEAGKLYSKGNEYGSIEEQFATYVTHLRDLKEEIQKYPDQLLVGEERLDAATNSSQLLPDPIYIVEEILSRFHAAAIQLRHRHGDRATLDVKDEYDVQDLLHALLRTRFDDIRAEDVSPSYAGGSSRIDFVLKASGIGIEVKFPTASLRDAKIGEQLLIDIGRYQAHPDCRVLVCFVYDPNHYLRNPAGLVSDLSKEHGNLAVHVSIFP